MDDIDTHHDDDACMSLTDLARGLSVLATMRMSLPVERLGCASVTDPHHDHRHHHHLHQRLASG